MDQSRPRPQCSVPGCTRQVKSKGRRNGKQVYSTLCGRHYAETHGSLWRYLRSGKFKDDWFYGLKQQPCSRCGWNEDQCEVHRVISGDEGGQYVPENTVPVCPNCHQVISNNPVKRQEFHSALEQQKGEAA